jgi:hypothetical protein
MQAPTCDLCGSSHFAWQAHRFVKPPERPLPNVRAKEPIDEILPREADPGAVERVRQWRNANRERYNEYMRQYMARRRASGKQ